MFDSDSKRREERLQVAGGYNIVSGTKDDPPFSTLRASHQLPGSLSLHQLAIPLASQSLTCSTAEWTYAVHLSQITPGSLSASSLLTRLTKCQHNGMRARSPWTIELLNAKWVQRRNLMKCVDESTWLNYTIISLFFLIKHLT